MPIITQDALPIRGPILGLDPGGRRWGIAKSDWAQMLATPVMIITRKQKFGPAFEAMMKIYEKHACVGLVVGLPLEMDGSEGRRAQSARALAYNVMKIYDVPICFQDERLSSAEADWVVHEATDLKTKTHDNDARAAAVILQRFLDAR